MMEVMVRSKSILTILVICLFAVSTIEAGNIFNGLFGRGIKGSGDLTTEVRDLEEFDEIDVLGSMDIYIEIGDEQKVEITFDDNLIELVRTRVRGHTLRIDTRESFSSRRGCQVRITVPKLEMVSLTGSGDVEVTRIKQKSFEIELSGSGEIVASGEVEQLDIDLAGSGDIDARELIADEANCDLGGSGQIKVYAKKSFNGDLSGSGDIYYYGDPKYVDRDVSGSGSIRRR
jgi:hypothetical protein